MFHTIPICRFFRPVRRQNRKKLLIVAGAGSSIEFGMPSVGDIHPLLLQSASQFFPLADHPTENLYGYLHKTIENYWRPDLGPKLRAVPNFEDVLYAIYTLASVYPAGIFTGPLGAFVTINEFPKLMYFGARKPVDANILRHLGQHLVDRLMDEFRSRCREPDPSLLPKIEKIKHLISTLADEFEIAVVTTNYDDLIYRSLPNVETGFDPIDGVFKQSRLINRASWPCFLHLHGSVHFDMDVVDGNLHGVLWKSDLNAQFHQNSFGRSSVRTTEGTEFPTSVIIAGYGKTQQIERSPFRTYYSELERLVNGADAVLFLGFSLADAHIRQAFTDFRDGRDRPVVVIDWANDGTMLAGSDFNHSDTGPARAIRVFRIGRGSMTWLGYTHPNSVNVLKAAREFERCTEPGRRLSIWYNGMLEACVNAKKIAQELNH